MFVRSSVLALLLFGSFNAAGAEFDYAQSEQGRWSIVHLADSKNPGYIGLVAVGIGTLALTATAVVVPTVLCQGTSVHNLICGAAGVLTGIVGGASAIGGIVGTAYWAKKLFGEVVPHTRRKYFAKLLNSAYEYLDSNSAHRTRCRNRLETFIMSFDINYKVRYVIIDDPIRVLAEKLVLANEAGRFSCWSALFPENTDVGLGKYTNSIGRPTINFPKADWEDADLNQIVFINVSRLLDERDESFNRVKLINDIQKLRDLKEKYDAARDQCRQEAKMFLQGLNHEVEVLDDGEVSLHVEY